MGSTLPEFTPLENSLWLTLCGKALDSRFDNSVLSDTMADEIVRKLDYDCDKFHMSTNPILLIAQRAKKLDEVAAGFIARNPDAIGLDLGAGLDTRVFRLDPPPGVDWYDVDFPDVITARKQVLPERPGAHGIGTDLTDPSWLDAVPTGRPAVIVADGLLAFLAPDDMIALMNRLIDHFPHGEIAFNGYSRFAIWAAKHYKGTQSVADLLKSPGFDDPREPESWNPRIKLVREILLTREPEVARFPLALRLFTQLASLSAWWSRHGTTVLHYRF